MTEMVKADELLEIRCQENKCSFGKPPCDRCCFGTIELKDIEKPQTQYHKCRKSTMYVRVEVRPPCKPAA